MRSLHWSLFALASASPVSAGAQACLASPEYAAPAAFVSAHVGRLSAADYQSSVRPVARGVTLRGMLWNVVGVARVERADGLVKFWYGTRSHEYSNYELSLVGNFSPEPAWGIRLCPLLGLGRRWEESTTFRNRHEPYSTGGTESRRWFIGLGAALPFALGSRWSTVPVVSWRRENVDGWQWSRGWRDTEGPPFNAVTASLGLAYLETMTLVLEYEALFGLRLESPDFHGVGDPGARNVRLAVGYHLPSRTRD
jgi:hypothetical protein